MPPGSPNSLAGAVDSASTSREQRHVAIVVQPQRRAEQRLQPDRAGGRVGEGQALGVDVLRVVRGDDDVDGAVAQRLDHRQPVVFGAQRRRQPEEGAVFADIVLVERQIVDRDAGGDPRAVGLGARDRRGRGAVEIFAAW